MEHTDCFRDHEIEEAITQSVGGIVQQVLWHLEEERALYRDRAMEIISDHHGSDTAAIGLNLDQLLTVVEVGAEELGLGDLTFSVETLRAELEGWAAAVIHMLAEGRAFGFFSDLFDFMEEHGLEPEQMRDSNNFGWFPHRSERDEGPCCTVYEYRNVEDPGNHIDAWEYRFPTGERVWFEVGVESTDQ